MLIEWFNDKEEANLMNNLNALVVDFVDIPLAKAIVEFNIKLFN
jgi:hypothetical protein